ncbi:hypothetical protein [Roseateles noduli]|uniref:hypothetical protein n=1 Tax=Roseateles noduli TaxID=2052484 RepID=UPI003D65B2B0
MTAAAARTGAWYAQGRALCGLPRQASGSGTEADRNVRRGSVLLLRAADGGLTEAWLDLHHLHANPRSTVANAAMAMFCLEKAAQAGDPVGQRRLGVAMLREAQDLPALELGMAWLATAWRQGDAMARALLQSFVMPVSGDEAAAQAVIATVRCSAPLLAARLSVARAFGLTRAEALSFSPLRDTRRWGLALGWHPTLRKTHLSSPRAVLALHAGAEGALREAISLYATLPLDEPPTAGRRRAAALRRLLAGEPGGERLLFPAADSTALQTLKCGPKWAHRQRALIREAMADHNEDLQNV